MPAERNSKPVIINDDSNFVVVTYWWGRGNINKNTGVPCPEDLGPGDGQSIKPPTTYDKMIDDWVKSCKKAGCNYLAIEYPEFAQKGMYQTAINFKPQFIKSALRMCAPRAVLYIDGDMHIQKYPGLFDMPGVDYMARNWNCDVRSGHMDVNNLCYSPYVFETSGGIMYFNNTPGAINLLREWDHSVQKYPGKAEDRLISQLFNNQKLLLPLSVIDIPVEYLWLNQEYDSNVPKKYWKKDKIYITHPECLTGEERAHDQGAASQRYPPRYNYQITDRITCKLKGMPFYEYIFFPQKSDVEFMGEWLKIMSSLGLIDRISFAQKYGSYNNLAKANWAKMKEMKKLKDKDGYEVYPEFDNTDVVYLVDKHSNLPHTTSSASAKNSQIDTNRFVILQKSSDLIAVVLMYLMANNDVVYVPKDARRDVVSRVARTGRDDEIAFVAYNTNDTLVRYKKEYTLKLDKEKPIFFAGIERNGGGEVLYHLLKMSKNLTQLQNQFNSSIIFPSRIRIAFF